MAFSLFPIPSQLLSLPPYSGICEDTRCSLHNQQELTEKKQFRLDVQEHEHLYIIIADMPGVNRQDITIRFRDSGLLDIVLNATGAETPTPDRYLIRERTCTAARRSLHLLKASGQGISAELQSGLLYVLVPKAIYSNQPVTEILVR